MADGGTSLDAICRGELVLEQPRRGYRFNLDPILLADFAGALGPVKQVVDLGAGVGVVGLLLARRWPETRVLLLELQPELALLAQANAERNGLAGRVEVRCADLRDPLAWSGWAPGLAVSNPPYFPLGAGRPCADAQRSLARHEVACSMGELLDAAAAGLAAGGALALIHAAEREEELVAGLDGRGLGPELLRRVVPLPGRPAARVLVAARGGARGGLRSPAPLLVEERPGAFTEEVRAILGEPPSSGGDAP